KKKSSWERYWKEGEVRHFIGKDISYFHYLFWPAMLMAMDIPVPKLTVHGFITVDGQKMSKSRGTFFTAKDFLKLYDPESLRFYYASHLDKKVVDIDLNFTDFQAVINNVFMGNLGNFCYRTLTFAEKNYEKVEGAAKNERDTVKVLALAEKIKENYLEQDYKAAIKNILKIADIGNAYFQNTEPWKNKDDKKVQQAVAWCVNLTKNLAIIINPILPAFSEKIYKTLSIKNPSWKDIGFTWKGKLKKIDLLVAKIETLPDNKKFPLQMIVGKIKKVEDHPDAETLYLLKVNLGAELGEKQVVAGLKKYFSKTDLEGRKAVFCANLKPAKLRGQLSEAMILAADDGARVGLLDAEKTEAGEEVKFEGLENSRKQLTFEEFLKIKMIVIAGEVFYEGKKLSSEVESISVKDVLDNAKVR
ncbi:MAG: class I tRNA ligase family protein, partial [Nanoarchaeota archaeon]|nr:class I tRNA ligase family protein [Nanoarchaeota archaeon]MBU1977466.1 class I tRNA ligase family protein [Nanoarchaeota archaeon]